MNETNTSCVTTTTNTTNTINDDYEESVIRCTCETEYWVDYGSLMIQCDTCKCWVHATCHYGGASLVPRITHLPDVFECKYCQDRSEWLKFIK